MPAGLAERAGEQAAGHVAALYDVTGERLQAVLSLAGERHENRLRVAELVVELQQVGEPGEGALHRPVVLRAARQVEVGLGFRPRPQQPRGQPVVRAVQDHLQLVGLDATEHADAEMPDPQRLRVLHPIHDVGPAAVHLDRERPVGSTATVLVEGAEPAGQFVPDQQESARQASGQGAERLDGGVGDRIRGRTGAGGSRASSGMAGAGSPFFTAVLTSTFHASIRASQACLAVACSC